MTFSLTPEHRAHLHAGGAHRRHDRGRAHLERDDQGQMLSLIGIRKDGTCPRSGWVIPYTAELERGYCRVRPDVPRLVKKASGKVKAVKYEAPKDSSAQIYAPVWVLEWARQLSQGEIWITEGEKKVLSILQSGRGALGIPGVWQGTVKDADGNHVLHPELAKWVPGRRVVVLFDADFDTNEKLPEAMARLVTALEVARADVYVSFVPGDKGKGIDDHFVGGGTWAEIDDRIRPVDPRAHGLLP
jgi:Domain of unknown function (DUF3854)